MEKVTVYQDYRNSEYFKGIHMKEFEAIREQSNKFDELKGSRKIVSNGSEAIKKVYGWVFLLSILLGVVAYFFAGVGGPFVIVLLWAGLKLYLEGMYQKAGLHGEILKEQIKNTRVEKENISLKLENKAMRDYMNGKNITL